MTSVFFYLRLILFLGGLLVGLQVPAFVDQYGKSLEAHFLESQLAIREFEDEANRFFSGDMEKLIDHYRRNPDPVFQEGGLSIGAIYTRYLLLEKNLASFRESAFHAYRQALVSPLPDIRQEVSQNFSHVISLQPAAIVFGLSFGLLISLAAELLLKGMGLVIQKRLLPRP